jgi:hypothetical protein
MVTARIDTSKLDAKIDSLRSALIGAGRPGDAATIVADESRKLAKQIVGFTPPKSLAQGRKAVARDIQRAATPFDASKFTQPKMRERIDALAKDGNYDALNAILKNIKGNMAKWRVAPFHPDLHRKARVSRGRVLSTKKIFVTQARALAAYIKKMQDRVGLRKSGWLPALLALGGKAPAWVARHLGHAPGTARVTLVGTNPGVTISSHAAGVGDDRRMIANAVNVRAKAMARRAKMLVTDYKNAWHAGDRIAPAAHKTASQDPE